MKKSFMFVAVAAAGMLASCSSESLTGSDPKIEPTTQEDRVPIEIRCNFSIRSCYYPWYWYCWWSCR